MLQQFTVPVHVKPPLARRSTTTNVHGSIPFICMHLAVGWVASATLSRKKNLMRIQGHLAVPPSEEKQKKLTPLFPKNTPLPHSRVRKVVPNLPHYRTYL